MFIIDQLRNTFQLKYYAELPSIFWANHFPLYNYKSVTFCFRRPSSFVRRVYFFSFSIHIFSKLRTVPNLK